MRLLETAKQVGIHPAQKAGKRGAAKRSMEGNVLLISLVSMSVAGVVLASYLQLVANQNLSVWRSQQWNNAVPVAEAGIEEALAHVNMHPTNRELNGWVLSGGAYTKERFIGESKFVTAISTSFYPVIISKGYVRVPLGTNFIEPPRTVRVTTTNVGMFSKGMVAKGTIKISGQVETDSFNSRDPNLSTDGRYDPTKTNDKGDVATNGQFISAIEVSGQVKIKGKVATGPEGSVGLKGPNVVIGSTEWHEGGYAGIEPGAETHDMNVDFPDVTPPFTGGGWNPSSGSVDGTNYTYTLGTGNYEILRMQLSGHEKMIVTGDAVLYVKEDVNMSGGSYIYIAPGASLKMYVTRQTSISGQGIANATGQAINFQYYGLPTNHQIDITGNAGFTGVIYAPQADLKLSGGGNDTEDFIGASVTKSAEVAGHYRFHYDESLGTFGPFRGYTITSWNEI